jgi:tetratricopeptide (TPR) repeat protein
MDEPFPALHRAILGVDIEGFADRRRTNPDQILVREGLYRSLEAACARSGIAWDACYREDRGDGALILVPPEIPKNLLVSRFPQELSVALRAHNDAHQEEARIRVRLAVHAGEIHRDGHGVASTAINIAFRLLEASELKQALRTSPGLVALIASRWFFEEVIRHTPASHPDAYRQVRVLVKETDELAWIALPDVAGFPADSRVSTSMVSSEGVPRQLPATISCFTGRSIELKRLDALLDDDSASAGAMKIMAVDGMPGIGKTTLAVHWAHQVASRFPDGQLYVNLRGFDPGGLPVSAAQAVRGFLDAFGISAEKIPLTLDAQASLYRSRLASRRVLVLLDNARDAEQVRPLLPGSPGCLVLITSRKQLIGLIAEGAHPLTLDLPTGAEAHQQFECRLGSDRVAAEPTSAWQIVDLCGRLPLALSIVAARAVTHPHFSLTALTAELRNASECLDAFECGDPAASVRAVLSWSYKQLDPPAARLFRLLGLHAGPDVSAAAAASLAGLPLDEGRRRLGELTRAHLLAEHVPGRFWCHDLLRAYAAELTQSADAEAERRAATGRMLDHYLHTAHLATLQLRRTCTPLTLAAVRPGAEPERVGDAGQAVAWFEAERLVLMAATGRALEAGFDTHAWQLVLALSDFLDMQGRWHDWAVIERVALAAAQRLGDREAQASVHQGFGYASGRIGRYEDAHAHLGLALGIHEERGDHAGQAYVHNSLAITLSYQGRQAEALGHARQSVKSYTAAGDRPGQARALNSVGWLSAMVGDHQQAVSYCEQSLGLFRDLGSTEGEASALDSLGYAHQQAGQHAEATACYQQALELHRAAGSRWGAGDTLGHLGDACRAAGKPEEARTFWEQALTILADLHAPEADQIRAKLTDPDAGLRL